MSAITPLLLYREVVEGAHHLSFLQIAGSFDTFEPHRGDITHPSEILNFEMHASVGKEKSFSLDSSVLG